MAQIATTKTDHAAADATEAATHPRAADVARDLTGKAPGTTFRLVEKAAAAEDRAGTSSPATAKPGAKPSLALPAPAAAAFEMLKAGGAVAGFWLQQGNDQLAHHARTVKKLAAANVGQQR
jgi:hypothetical protein